MKHPNLVAIASLISTTVFSTFISAFPSQASANNYPNRLSDQQQRINQGIRNGTISPKENANLSRRQNALNAAVLRDIQDGKGLTSTERYKLNRRADNISRSIYLTKRN